MLYCHKVFFCPLWFLIILQIKSELVSENESSISEFIYASHEDEADPIYLITGGYRPAKHTLAKYVVSIRVNNQLQARSFGSTHICGGSILNPELILTAAHCILSMHPSVLEVVTGTPIRLVRTMHTQVIDVSNVIIHRNYDMRAVLNDIGLLKLKGKIDLDGTYAQAIALPRAPAVVGAACVTLGWGDLFSTGPRANEILYVNLTIIDKAICKASLPIVSDRHICASDPYESQRDSCQGDSGGPLICNDLLTGIISFGHGCGTGKPAAHTDVFEYLEWISKSTCGRSRQSFWMLWYLSLTWAAVFVW